MAEQQTKKPGQDQPSVRETIAPTVKETPYPVTPDAEPFRQEILYLLGAQWTPVTKSLITANTRWLPPGGKLIGYCTERQVFTTDPNGNVEALQADNGFGRRVNVKQTCYHPPVRPLSRADAVQQAMENEITEQQREEERIRRELEAEAREQEQEALKKSRRNMAGIVP